MTDETMITAAEARALREAATPGPWWAEDGAGGHLVVADGDEHAEAPFVHGVADCDWQADAALIAAAPALALALEASDAALDFRRRWDAAHDNGEGARVDGESRSPNPFAGNDDELADAWNTGWERQDVVERLEQSEAALKAAQARVSEARIMAGLILSAYDPATSADRAAPTAAAAIERAHRFLLDTKLLRR